MSFLRRKRFYNGRLLPNLPNNNYITPFPTLDTQKIDKCIQTKSVLWSQGNRNTTPYLNSFIPRFMKLLRPMTVEVLDDGHGQDIVGAYIEYTNMKRGTTETGEIKESYITGNKLKKYTYDIKFGDTIHKNINIRQEGYRVYRKEMHKYLCFESEIFTMIHTLFEYYDHDQMIKRGNLINKVC